jgi:hypothetical protein
MASYLELLINPILQFVGISPEVLEPGEKILRERNSVGRMVPVPG